MADAAIRSFAAVELMILINAEEITARSVALSAFFYSQSSASLRSGRKDGCLICFWQFRLR